MTQAPKQLSDTATTGGCLCGAVKLETSGSPKRVGICHCRDCRKHHGALFFAAAVFASNQVTITGETNSFRGRHFCPTCGSSVYAVSDEEVEVHLGVLDHNSPWTPSYELWCVRRAPWLTAIQGATQHPRKRS
ncbi:GFA family protein [Thalassobius sp. MITS945101]|uniref:GFA family protein n=1 Tax=Thalassobius sp. MITS945101 TaxID=3096994 RepID=UPI00399AF161